MHKLASRSVPVGSYIRLTGLLTWITMLMMGPRGRKSDVNEPGVKRRQLRILLAWRREGAFCDTVCCNNS